MIMVLDKLYPKRNKRLIDILMYYLVTGRCFTHPAFRIQSPQERWKKQKIKNRKTNSTIRQLYERLIVFVALISIFVF